ncbi:hypothetical protein POM88_010083 [Heracleum sosnowskyi]|uniref:Pollen Ole e 1 allergen and extensin family protein n=1 Tax=Heracleum sosnowskyi TaxID=360622 RepID=A0AAD8J954_9APIA|nr:hypothetical protein POM88_010083 [Heracleum sosnowskyi]
MASLIVASFLLLAYMIMNVVGESYDGVINVEGRVRCLDCTQGQRLIDSKPIQGSRVSLTCYGRSQAVYYSTDKTDETGIYQLTVSSYINGKKLNPRDCFVRLVYSADPACSIATVVNGGSTGVRLDVPTTVNANITKYRLHSFFYATPSCNGFA